MTPQASGSATDPASLNKMGSDWGNLALPSGFCMPREDAETPTHICENSNGMFGGLQSRLLLACGRFHVTKPENEVFYPLLIKRSVVG